MPKLTVMPPVMSAVIMATVCPVRIIFTFSGLCLDQLGGTCLPKRQPKIISHQVVFYDVNGTQVCLRLSSVWAGEHFINTRVKRSH